MFRRDRRSQGGRYVTTGSRKIGRVTGACALACAVLGPPSDAGQSGRHVPSAGGARASRVGGVVARPKALAERDATSPAAWYRLESGPVDFGDVLPGEPAQVAGGIRARVFSEGDWSLSLVPRTALRALDAPRVGDSGARLSWRGELSGDFVPLDARPVVVAAGAPTGPAGRLVVLDLQLALAESDDLGAYECRLDLTLDARSPGQGPRNVPTSIQRIGEKR